MRLRSGLLVYRFSPYASTWLLSATCCYLHRLRVEFLQSNLVDALRDFNDTLRLGPDEIEHRLMALQTHNLTQAFSELHQLEQVTTTQAQHDLWMREMRTVQAESSSRLAQIDVKWDRTAEQIAQITTKQDRAAEQITQLTINQDEFIEEQRDHSEEFNRKLDRLHNEVQALAEASRAQLAGIIGNGRRIDRLEQQAS